MFSLKESNRIEYKVTLNDTFEKEIVAFLNSNEGGVLYIGIDDNRKIVGCENIDEIQLKIKDKLKHNISPLIENNEYGYCSLIKATHKVLEKLEVENKTAALITSTTRKEQPLWNKVALREAVINAIVHNDYTTQNPPVFEIFSDRIEITSTGGLNVIKNLDDFFAGYSNPTSREIMRIYKDLELVEHLGSGLNRILSVYDKESFLIKQNFMRNIFYSNTNQLLKDEGVNEGVKTLYELIKKYPNNRSTFFVKKMDTSIKNIERWIKQLKSEDKIEFKGSPKTGGYFAI